MEALTEQLSDAWRTVLEEPAAAQVDEVLKALGRARQELVARDAILPTTLHRREWVEALQSEMQEVEALLVATVPAAAAPPRWTCWINSKTKTSKTVSCMGEKERTTMTGMRVVKGKVVGNTVVLEEAVPEGSAVDVVLHEAQDNEDFVLTEEMRRELREASESAKGGESVDMDAVLAEAAAVR